MPPLSHCSRTTSTLVAAVEETARALATAGACSKATRRRAIRGCSSFEVTPDPGVIEVNVHPAHELGRAGRATRRRSTRRRGSAGSAPRSSCSTAATPAPAAATTSSSAAPTPADSPFLRRPDLLRSLVALLAQSSVALVPVLGPVHRPDEPGAARRRGAQRRALRARDSPSGSCPTTARRARRGWSTASSAICWST